MSILQEYEGHNKIINQSRIGAISDYISYMSKSGVELLYSDVVYKRAEWEKFERWYNDRYGKSSEGDKKI
ncbi:hypothetical protein IJU85_02150 [Candidatus Saccharibacteria bacterium]|nr:hypothetical protein [Candidatus Saccharibacteria bacterium]